MKLQLDKCQRLYPVGKIARVFLTTWHCILSAELTNLLVILPNTASKNG